MIRITPEREALIKQYLELYPNLTGSSIAIKLKEENSFSSLKEKGIAEQVNRLRKELGLEKRIDVKVENDAKWTVIDGNYEWKANKGFVSLSVEFIDQLFYEYSEHGLNLSQTEIINKHNLKVWEWHSIKNTLQLYKKANVFSPYTVEIATKEGRLEEMIAEKIERVFQNTGYVVEQQYNKQLRSEYKKVIKKQTEKELTLQTILMELQDNLSFTNPEEKPVVRVQKDATGSLSVFIFDVHFGAESRSEFLPPYSPEILDKQFEQIASEVNSYNAKEVHIFFGGDNIETFTGLNHPDSWKGIAKGYYGAELIKRAYQAFVKFISKVNNVKAVYAVPGNHDRATESRAVDSQGYIGAILFELIKLSFQDKIAVLYEEKVMSIVVEDVNYIMTHGHLKLTDISPAELILQYGKPDLFNVLVSGHWHNRKIKKDHRLFRQIVCPSIFPGNDYSEGLGVSSLPGFLIVESKNRKPKITDCPL